MTYGTLIQTVTVGSGGSSAINFTSIPQIYTDLILVRSIRADSTSGPAMSANITFNNSTTGYTERLIYNNSSNGSLSSARSGSFFDWAGMSSTAYGLTTSNTFGSGVIHIPNYTSSNQKSISSDSVQVSNTSNGSYWNIYVVAGIWSGISAITSIQITSSSGLFVENSSVSLYGVKRTQAIGKPKAIGGTITYSDGYWYHTFTGSGTFSTTQKLNCDALVVAGGGAGGREGAGGGAGGYLSQNLSLTPGSYLAVIGAGGSPMIAKSLATYGNGAPSTFAGLTAIGGGGGGGYNDGFLTAMNGAAGGSGGGAWGNEAANFPGAGTTGQGNAGGAGGNYTSAYGEGAGGGGGAGSAGSIGRSGSIPYGGDGLRWFNGTYYAGGGGGYGSQAAPNNTTGGPGGAGGGGNGGYSNVSFINGGNGSANTGGGGGGCSYTSNLTNVGTPGSGGSGIVIVRYLAD